MSGTGGIAVRRLSGADAVAFRALRLEALRAHPDAFGADHEDEQERPEKHFAAMLDTGFVLGGGTVADRLDGIAGVYLPAERKARHKAVLWGMYVRPDARGTGLARRLIAGCIAHARTIAEELVLSVGAHNAPALARYRAMGFLECGSEERAIKTGDRYYDEILMTVRFGDAVG